MYDFRFLISDLYLGTSRRTRPLPRGVAGHVAHPALPRADTPTFR
jgi:hypothetical protein